VGSDGPLCRSMGEARAGRGSSWQGRRCSICGRPGPTGRRCSEASRNVPVYCPGAARDIRPDRLRFRSRVLTPSSIEYIFDIGITSCQEGEVARIRRAGSGQRLLARDQGRTWRPASLPGGLCSF